MIAERWAASPVSGSGKEQNVRQQTEKNKGTFNEALNKSQAVCIT